MASETSAAAGGGGEAAAFARAHAQMLRDKSLQFHLEPFKPKASPPPRAQGNGVDDVIAAIAPLVKIIVWGGLILAAVLILAFIARELLKVRFPNLFRPKLLKEVGPQPAAYRPDLARARVLLDDADRLAAEGRFAEAVHLLLFRTVDDIDGRRPNLVRPALTARDIAALQALPDSARAPFRIIAEVVERSFFGGRPVDEAAFRRCRAAYEAFLAPEAWA